MRTIASEQRYGRNIEETVLVFDAGTKSLTIGSSTYEITQAEKELELHSMRDRIVSFVATYPGSTEPEVMQGVSGNGKVKSEQLRDLLQDSLWRGGRGVAGDPFRYYADVPVEA